MARWFVDRLPQQGIPSISLRRLLPEARFLGCQDWEVSGCTNDSRRLDPGQVFVAIRGARRDGHTYVAQALERGAAGVVVEKPCPEAGRLQVVVPDSRVAHARLCQALAGDPGEQLLTIGDTGTCGKTVTSLFLRSIFEATGVRFGLVGALGWSDGVTTRPVSVAFPGPSGLATMLAEMVERGCSGGIIEVPSSALEQRALEGLEFDIAVVTDVGNVRGQTTEELFARRRVKSRLIRKVVSGGTAVVNADDPHAQILGAVNLDAKRVSFGVEQPADVTARIERLDANGARFVLRGFDREAPVALRLTGPAHVSNALAAAAVALSQGLALDAIVAGLETVTHVPGRLEAVNEGQDFTVWIDQAQNGPELSQVLTALRSLGAARIYCVFGAEGLRDRMERLNLSTAAETGADQVILTADNPRTEDLNQIFDDLLSGFFRPGRVQIEPNRRRAIEMALALASPGDAVLIVGKGRRTFQIFADHAVPFDDGLVATQWLRAQQRKRSRRTSA
jgi:UDP-N-acetylmuramoyl-L-alanyl-D-glutamate--2,6-diaminopimelate ligase